MGEPVVFQDKLSNSFIMLRFFILVVMFTLVVIGLPQLPAAQSLLSQLRQISSQTAFYTNVLILILAAPIAWMISRHPDGWAYRYPGAGTQILQRGIVGVVIAALFTVFEALSGYAVTLTYLLLIPLAFLAGEIVYQLTLLALARFRNRPDLHKADAIAQQTAELKMEGKVPRMLVTLPIYVIVVVFLPQQDDFRQLEASLTRIDPNYALWACGLALLISVALPIVYFQFLRKAANKDAPDPVKAAHIVRIQDTCLTSIAVGLGFAALINLVSALLGTSPSLVLLILMPIGFLIAEIVYAILDWRLRYPPM